MVRRRRRLRKADETSIDSLAAGDPARELIAEILSVVPASHWSFARFSSRGTPDQLLVSDGDSDRRFEFEHARAELALQRRHARTGPRLAARLLRFERPYTSGVTLVFANASREYGVLILLRTEELGAFTSVEIQALALALDASTDRLTGLDIGEGSAPEGCDAPPAMHILDRDLNVVLTWESKNGRASAITAAHARLAKRLPPLIEAAVREVVKTWSQEPSAGQEGGVSRVVPFLTVRTQPLTGAMGLFVGVLLSRPPHGEFNQTSRAYKLTSREIETLGMLLHGATLKQVGDALHITTSTVQDHIKSMLAKTNAKNRSELIAKLFAGAPPPIHP